MLKILICDGLDESGLKILRAAEGVEADVPEGLDADEIKAILPEYDAMIVRSRTKVTADLIESAQRLKVVGRAGTGVDNIDVEAAIARGILVMNTPGANAMAAAEHTLAMMLALARHIPQATRFNASWAVGKEEICRHGALSPDPGHRRSREHRLDCRRPRPGNENECPCP